MWWRVGKSQKTPKKLIFSYFFRRQLFLVGRSQPKWTPHTTPRAPLCSRQVVQHAILRHPQRKNLKMCVCLYIILWKLFFKKVPCDDVTGPFPQYGTFRAVCPITSPYILYNPAQVLFEYNQQFWYVSPVIFIPSPMTTAEWPKISKWKYTRQCVRDVPSRRGLGQNKIYSPTYI